MTDRISQREFMGSEGVSEWRILGGGANAFYPIRSLTESAKLVQAISEIPGADDNPPAIDIRADGVNVRLSTFREGFGGLSRRDLEIAQQVSAAARALGLSGDPDAVQSMLAIPGALDIKKITPFWQAALGYVPRPDSPEEDLIDPRDRGIPLWFETMDELRPGGLGSIHLVVWVPYEQAEERIQRALAAGGRIVHDGSAPSYWTLADAAGNEVDIATDGGRRA